MTKLQHTTATAALCALLFTAAHLATAQMDHPDHGDHGMSTSALSYDRKLKTIMRAFGVMGEPVISHGVIGMTSMVSMFNRPHLLPADEYLSFPMMVTSVCVAYNLPGAKDPYTTKEALQDFLWGRRDNFLWDGDATSMPASRTQLLLSSASPTNIVVGRVVGVKMPMHHLPASMYSRSHVRQVVDDEAGVNTVKFNAGTVMLLPLQVAKLNRLPCADVADVAPDGVTTKYSAELPVDAHVDLNTDTLTAVPADFFPGYPIMGVMALHMRKFMLCDEAHQAVELFRRLAASPALDLQKELWGFVALPAFTANTLMHTMLQQYCPEQVIYSSGTSVTKHLFSKASLSYTPEAAPGTDAQKNYTVLYGSGGSGTGIRAIKASTIPFAGSDALLSDEELAEFPSFKFAPLAAFSVCVVVPRKLVIPKCLLPALYNGSITHWDHPALQEANLFAGLPHERIETMGVTTRSGTTEVFQRALRLVQEECDGHSNIEVSGYYKLPATHYKAKTWHMLPEMRANPNLLSYATWANVVEWNLPYAVLQTATGRQLSPRPEDVVTTLQDAKMDQRTSYVSVQMTDRSYPIIGMSYAVVDTQLKGSAYKAKHTIDFLRHMYTDESVPQMYSKFHLVRPSAQMRNAAMAVLDSVHVNGQPLYPKPQPKEKALSGGAVGGIAAGAVVAAALLLLLVLRATTSKGRDVRFAPKDGSDPFAVMFTDVQNSTALWAREPAAMNDALDEHNAILRKLIAKHKCYEVKTIGDAFMVVGSSPTAVMRLALDAQDALHDAPMSKEEINATYAELEAERSCEQAMVNVAKNPVPFNGLRVRIGLHLGMGSIQVMPETGAYDYFGTVVNTAARVEAAGHGGQVVATEEFCAGIPTTELEGLHMAFLGSHTLRGLDAPHSLHLLARQRFASRLYPPLRLDGGTKEAEEEMDDEARNPALLDDGAESQHSGTTRGSAATQNATSAGMVIQRILAVYKGADRIRLLRELCVKWHVNVRDDDEDAAYTALGEKIGRLMNIRRRSSVSINHHSETASDRESRRESLPHSDCSGAGAEVPMENT